MGDLDDLEAARKALYYNRPVGSSMHFIVRKVWELELLFKMVTNNVCGEPFAVSSAFGSNLAQIQMRVNANFKWKYLSYLLELEVQQGVQNDRNCDMM